VPKRTTHISTAGPVGSKGVQIPVIGPPGLRVERDPRLSVRVLEGKSKELSPPDPEDPYVVCFRDVRHFEMPSGVRRAHRAARRAARKNQELSIVIGRAKVLPSETLVVVQDVGRKAGVSGISLYVKRLK
jgi:hypothetical protein